MGLAAATACGVAASWLIAAFASDSADHPSTRTTSGFGVEADTVVGTGIGTLSTGNCVDRTYVVPHGVTQVRIQAAGNGGTKGQDVTSNLVGGTVDYPGGAGGEGSAISATVPVVSGQTLYLDAGSAGIPGGPGSSDNTGGGGGSASWVSNANPVVNGQCDPNPNNIIAVAAGGGGGGGAGVRETGQGGGGGTEGVSGGTGGGGGNGVNSLIGGNAQNGGQGGQFPTGTAGGAGGGPGSASGCTSGNAGTGGSSLQGGGGGDAGVPTFGEDDCSIPPSIEGSPQFVEDSFGGGGGGGGGGFYGGGGGGGGDDWGGGGGGGAAGLSFARGANDLTVTPTRNNAFVEVDPIDTTPTITSADNATFRLGSSSSFDFTATGIDVPFVTIQNLATTTLPAGVFLSNGLFPDGTPDGTATISGVPTQLGVFDFTVEASNGGGSVTQNFTLTVTAPPSFTSPSGTTFVAGQSNSFTVTTGGYPQASIGGTSVPSWATLTDNGNGTATLSGAPPATGAADMYGIDLSAANGVGHSAAQTLVVQVVTAVSVSPTTVHLVPGGTDPVGLAQFSRGFTQQFRAMATYPDGTTGDITGSVVWRSSDPTVATISGGGLVSGDALGTSTITAFTAGPLAPTGTVIVAMPDAITVTPATLDMIPHETQQFTATATYPAGTPGGTSADITSNVTWSSLNGFVTVTPLGFATANVGGDGAVFADVYSTLSGNGHAGGSADVSVTRGDVTSIVVSPANLTELTGTEDLQYHDTVTYQDGSAESDTPGVTFSETDVTGTDVAVIGPVGDGNTVSPGTARITASFTNTDGTTVTGSTLLTVITVPTSIFVTPADNGNPLVPLPKGTTRQYQAIANYSDNTQVDVTTGVTWSVTACSPTPTVPCPASITPGGLVTATGDSDNETTVVSATFTYTDTTGHQETISGNSTLSMTILQPTSIAITPATVSPIGPGDNVQFTATATYPDGSTLDLTDFNFGGAPVITWGGDFPPGVAHIGTGGLLTADTGAVNGTLTVQAFYEVGAENLSSNQVTVDVVDPLDHIQVFSSAPTSPISVTAGDSTPYPFYVQGYDKDGNLLGDVTADSTLSISPDGGCNQSADTCSATVADTSTSAHTVTATDPNAAVPGSTNSVSVTFTPGPLDHIALSGGSTTITAGDNTAPYHVTAYDSLGNSWDVTNLTEFDIAPVSTTSGCTQVWVPPTPRTCTATVQGEDTVTVSYQGQQASVPLWVNPFPALDHITLSGGPTGSPAYVGVGGTTPTYSVTGYDKYGNSSDITGQTALSISPDGTCDDSAFTCSPADAGSHTVTASTVDGPLLTSNGLTFDAAAPAQITANASFSMTLHGIGEVGFTLRNTNSIRLNNLAFTAPVPASFAPTPSGGITYFDTCGVGTGFVLNDTYSFSGGFLNGSNSTCQVGFFFEPFAVGLQTITTTGVSSTEGGTGAATSMDVNVTGPPAVAVSFGASSVAQGSPTTLTFTVTNPNAVPPIPPFAASATGQSLSGLGFFTTLPSGLAFADSNVTGSCDGGQITVNPSFLPGEIALGPNALTAPIGSGTDGATLAADTSCSFTVDVKGTSTGTQTVTTTQITSNERGDGNAGSASIDVTSPLGSFTMSSVPTLTAGTSGQVTITAYDSTGHVKTDYAGTPTLTGNLDPSTSGCGTGGTGPCDPTYALGSFTDGVATATITGYDAETGRTITVTDGSVSATSSPAFTVDPGGLDHLVLGGGSASIDAGGATAAYSAEGYDPYGNDLGDVTSATVFTLPSGSCTGTSCTTVVAGSQTVTGTDGSATGTAGLDVVPLGLDHLVLNGGSASITAGDNTGAYQVEGYDIYGNDLGDATAASTLSVSPDGSCSQSTETCTATVADTSGHHTVTATDSSATNPTATADLTVDAAGLDHLVLNGGSASITAGDNTGAYQVEGYDIYGNDLGDATAASTLSVSPDGSCSQSTETCTATVADTSGHHTVTATDSSATNPTATADLTVDAAGLDHLVLNGGSASITAGDNTGAYQVEGYDIYGNDLGDMTAASTLSVSPDGSCSQSTETCTATVADTSGHHTVTATDSSATNPTATADLTVDPAGLDHLVLNGGSASIDAGGTTGAYGAEGYDIYGNDLGDVTSATTFSLPGGSCTGAACTTDTAGFQTVTGADGSATGTAALAVVPLGLDHLVLSPSSATITAGGSQIYSAEGYDIYDNDLGDVTSATSFALTHGHCIGTTCISDTAGTQTVTGTDGTATGTASLKVDAAGLHRLVLSPASATITAGGSQVYSAEGYDIFSNPLGDVTSATTFSLPGGSCTGDSCTTTTAGTAQTVTGKDGSATGTASLTVDPASLDHLVLGGGSPSINAGGTTAAYGAEGYDKYGNDLGDVTSATTFSVFGGSCTNDRCTTTVAGDLTVKGIDGSATGSADLDVVALGLDHVALNGGSSSIAAGATTAAFQVEGYDIYDNDLGDVTSNSMLSIGPDGTCSQTTHTCTASVADSSSTHHTVTATDSSATHPTATAGLTVVAGGLDHIALTGGSSSINAGGTTPAFQVEGYDVHGNPLGDVTSNSTLSIGPDGTCSPTTHTCSATAADSSSTHHTVTATDSSATHPTATAILTVDPAGLDHLVLNGGSASIDVGGTTAAYQVEGYDIYGNDLGDVTAKATLSISPDGTCSQPTHTCSATVADSSTSTHTVTATLNGATHPTASKPLVVINPDADLAVNVAGPASAVPATTMSYTITVSNNGPGQANSVVLRDSVPAGTEFESEAHPTGWSCTDPGPGATATLTCSLSALASTAVHPTLTVVVYVDAGTTGTVTNTATVTSATTDPNSSNNTSKAVSSIGCSRTVTGRVNGSLVLNAPGSTCLSKANVSGGLTVSNGATVVVSNSTISSGVTAQGAGAITMCGSTVSGATQITGSKGFVLLGDPGDDVCAGNSFSGSVTLTGNLGGLDVRSNKVSGSVTITSNMGGGPWAGDVSPNVSGNKITGTLGCAANTPAPLNDGQANSAGTKTGQCAKL